MHDQGIVHGDLRGVRSRILSRRPVRGSPGPKVNILIDDDGRACLTGFGLVTVVSDQPTILPALTGDRIRWSSPERLYPERFNLKERHPMRESDRYALGMVIYKLLSGHTPFSSCTDVLLLVEKILDGERPGKPLTAQGAWFTDDLWEMLNQCWAMQSKGRPSIDAVLGRLEEISKTWKPPLKQADEDLEEDEDDWDLTEIILQ